MIPWKPSPPKGSGDVDPSFGYQSCIKIDGRSILPPVMTEGKRQEMRRYRQLAMHREAERQLRNEQSHEGLPLVPDVVSPVPVPATVSTPIMIPKPKVRRTYFDDLDEPLVRPNKSWKPPYIPALVDEIKVTKVEDAETQTIVTAQGSEDVGVGTSTSGNDTSESPALSEGQNEDLESSQIPDPLYTSQTFASTLANENVELKGICSAIEDTYAPPVNQSLNTTVTILTRSESVCSVRFDDVPAAVATMASSAANTSSSPNNNPDTAIPPSPGQVRVNSDIDDDNHSNTSFESAYSGFSSATFTIGPSPYRGTTQSQFSDGEILDIDDDDLDEAANLGDVLAFVKGDSAQYDSDNANNTENVCPADSLKDDNDDDITSACDSAATTTVTVPSTSSVFDIIGLTNLKKKMKLLSPSVFKKTTDSRSPLLKGVVFMDPLQQPRGIRRIPPESMDPAMKPKFDQVTACVKGYLVRRLLKTEKVSLLLQTIQESVGLIQKLYEDGSHVTGSPNPTVLPGDVGLHACLVQQLSGACNSIQDIFLKLSTKERMAIISSDRTMLKSKAARDAASNSKKTVSTATVRSMQRRKTGVMQSPVPKRPKYHQPDKLSLQVPSHVVPRVAPVLTQPSKSTKARRSSSIGRRQTIGKMSSPRVGVPTLSSYRPSAITGRQFLGNRGGRLSQLDKIKSSSIPNLPTTKRVQCPVSLSPLTSSCSASARMATNNNNTKKKPDATFVKPKAPSKASIGSKRLVPAFNP